jgi:internalin A
MTDKELLKIITIIVRNKVTSLNLSEQQLTTLPAQINQLTKLTKLEIKNNSLITLPQQIGQLTNLTRLDLRNNQLTVLPSEIGQLTNLTTLNLSHNQLTELPSEIGHLTKLKRLDLDGNLLTKLPDEIKYLTNLAELNLQDNKLITLPTGIGQLTNLTDLNLHDNQLTILPVQIGQLIGLMWLNLGNNELTTLLPQIGQLFKLRALLLFNNQLTVLPSQIGQLTDLRVLNVSSNQLYALPPQIDQLVKLRMLDLSNNPLPLPPEILELKNKPIEIINYYLQYQTDLRKPLNEAKALIVGQGDAGKTSLAKRLVEGTFDRNERKTEGINIKLWPIQVEGEEIRLNVWDFGGQEIMHATHQFFLTKRSLYILVLNSRQGEQDNKIEYWLKLIQSFGSNSPIIVVINKIDDHALLEIDERGLRAKYDTIKAFVRTSCETGQGIQDLKTVIATEVSQLEHLHDQLLLSWFNIKTQLEKLKQNYIPYTDYERMCQSAGITEEGSQRTLIHFLHDLGVVLNFQDDPRLEETSILNPKWVTNGVYKILNSPILFESKGVLIVEQLSRILDNQAYPKNKQLFIIDMMRKFELCFEFEGTSDQQFLIPELLSVKEPELKWSEVSRLNFQYHYNILPGSIISRFIVRMHNYTFEETYWRNGVLLTHEGNQALVKADQEDRKIFIWVTGPEQGRRSLLAIIRSHFNHIHRTIPKIEAKEIVTLPDRPDVEIEYEDLRILEAHGIEWQFHPKLKAKYNVQELLNMVDSSDKRLNKVKYNFSNIYKLLTNGFSEEELRIFCLTEPAFSPVQDTTSSDAGKAHIIRVLIEYAVQKIKVNELLDWAQELNPNGYEKYKPYFGK